MITKRVLKKVRKDFLNKKDDQDETALVDPSTHILGSDQVHMIKACNCLVLVNRKICMGLQYLNSQYDVSAEITEAPFQPRRVYLNVRLNRQNETAPWEYTVKRLESYGDLDLAMWAHKVKEHYTNYPRTMNKYFELLNSQDPKILQYIEKCKNQAQAAMEEIENKYPYRKLSVLSSKESAEILCSSYNESFLNEVGHTPESFIECTQKNGLPAYFAADCGTNHHVAQKFLACVILNNNGPISEEPEFDTFIFDKNGDKKRVIGEVVNILEPTPEGIMVYIYFLIKKHPTPGNMLKLENESIEALEKLSLNCPMKKYCKPDLQTHEEKVTAAFHTMIGSHEFDTRMSMPVEKI